MRKRSLFSTIISGKIHHSVTQRWGQTAGMMCLWNMTKHKQSCKETTFFDLFSFLIPFPSCLLIKGWTSATSLLCKHHFSGATCGITYFPTSPVSARVPLPCPGHSHSPPTFPSLAVSSSQPLIQLLGGISSDRRAITNTAASRVQGKGHPLFLCLPAQRLFFYFRWGSPRKDRQVHVFCRRN